MIKNRDFIIVGLQALDNAIGSNCINISYEIAKNNRVLYVNYPVDRFSKFREKNDPRMKKRKNIIRGKEADLVKIQDNFWNLYPRTILESISQLGNKCLFDYLNKINNRRFAKQIQSAIDRLGFKDVIIFNDSDMYRSFYLKEFLKPALYIYYMRDNMIFVDFWKKHGVRIEGALMGKSSLVVANSTYLADYGRKFNKNSFYVGQGCDTSLFDNKLIKEIPEDIKVIKDFKKPIIGYIGVLFTLRLDIDVLVYLAKNKPEWSIVLVGPEDDKFKASELHSLSNVYFLGSKKMDELPKYLAQFDVALNPQILNEVTIGNYPRKIDEYLAMGKPTVATKTEAMSVFADHTYLATNKEEYLELTQKALDENTKEKITEREKFAKSHTWENNVKEIYKAIEEVEK